MPDPTEPGWRPEFTGDGRFGHVGSGRRLGAHLYYLYRAGRNELPDIAAIYAGATGHVHGITGMLKAQFDRPGRGMELAHWRLLDLREEAHEVLRATCLRMQEVGTVLVRIADDFAATDQEAADEFSRLLDDNADEFADEPPYVPPPPRPDDPPPTGWGWESP
jgi:hypothetical protein